MGILAVDDEEGELAHWAWGYDSENLSNVEEVAGERWKVAGWAPAF